MSNAARRIANRLLENLPELADRLKAHGEHLAHMRAYNRDRVTLERLFVNPSEDVASEIHNLRASTNAAADSADVIRHAVGLTVREDLLAQMPGIDLGWQADLVDCLVQAVVLELLRR